ncbi:MAG: histidine kinase [Azospirillaceae bacterium]|nr:histidine kinase [Azospirillaceae bacterium]
MSSTSHISNHTVVPAFVHVAGLCVCVISGVAGLALRWQVVVGTAPDALLPTRMLVSIVGPLPAAALQSVLYLWLALCAAGTVLFAWVFHATTRPRPQPARLAVAAFCGQTALGILLNSDFLILTSIELPFVFAPRRAVVALIGQELVFLVASIFTVLGQDSGFTVETQAQLTHFSEFGMALVRILDSVTIVGWHLFAFAGGHLSVCESARRAALAAANAELLATQQLLQESARSSERLRIARDLHDAIGHDLTALGLHLDVACRSIDGRGLAAVQTARDVARRLLGEVRSVVGLARRAPPIDLRRALTTLCAGVPEPRIILDYDDALVLPDVEPALILFRIVQEALSNVVRHAAARRVEIRIAGQGDAVIVSVRDDGRGAVAVQPGNGLTGLRERLQTVGGTLQWTGDRIGGFVLEAWLPLPGRAP